MEQTNDKSNGKILIEENQKMSRYDIIRTTLIGFFVYLWEFLFKPMCNSKAKLHGKTVIITGANTGIGKETALDLAVRGAKVIIACRDTAKGKKAAEDICKQVPNANVTVRHLDLASFSSIREFAGEVLTSEPHIHILINNAGLALVSKSATEDGFETQFGVNHLGHFLLTELLLDRIKASAPARIVNVASAAYMFGRMHFNDINLERKYNPFAAYCRSKLSNVLFSRELAKRLEGTGVTTYCLHPGVVDTELARNLNATSNWLMTCIYFLLSKLFFKNPKQGAQTTIYCAVEESLSNESGLYYCGCTVIPLSGKASSDAIAKKLWDVSEELIASVK